MKLGFVGLGKMGSRMVEKILKDGHEVVVWNRTEEKISELKAQISKLDVKREMLPASSIQDLISKLGRPRIVWSMVPAGEATNEILKQVQDFIEEGDIVIDGGNSKFSDTEQWFKKFKAKKVRFLGIGVSGGLIAFEEGYPLMVGGDRSAYDEIGPILDSLAKPHGGHEYFGEGGAGHYVKMIHNAIEYGYMQSIGEGFGIMEKSEYDLDLLKAAKLYQKGSLISGFMMQRTIEALREDPKIEKIEGVIGKASGETIWALEEAQKLDVPAIVIGDAKEFRDKSETDENVQRTFAARLVSALRKAFGGHSVVEKGGNES